jgi:hypothetical protein
MITPSDFYAMPLDMRLETLQEEACWMSTINDLLFQVKIFKLGDFFVETWYDYKSDEIVEMVCVEANPMEDVLGYVKLAL